MQKLWIYRKIDYQIGKVGGLTLSVQPIQL
jgi:hypothetical protein